MPVITVSRMFGSGGAVVAQRIARRLGWALYDNAFVEAVAERLGVPVAEVEAREERVPNLVRRFADSLALASPEVLPPTAVATLPPSEERIVEVTQRIIDEAVARGPAVFVGRGAHAALSTRSDVLHVFCHAPKAALVMRVAVRMNVSTKEAEHLVNETNRQREQYVRKYWKRSWSAHETYHLCLNTEWLGLAGAADLVVRLAAERFGVEPLPAGADAAIDPESQHRHNLSGPFTL